MMTVHYGATLIILFNLQVMTNTLLNQDFGSPEIQSFESNKLRQHFLIKRRQNLVNGKRVELLDKYLSNSTIFVDGLAHHIIDEQHNELKDVNEIENEYKKLIQMKGIRYTYKRDTYWRTWRKVRYPEGKEEVLCYRCTNSINATNCQYGGYWIVEDKPPRCPYEIFSVINDIEFCASSLINHTNIEKKCPFTEQFSELTTMCDNPIETKFRILKVYGNDTERNPFPVVICNGRDFCEITTVYMISRAYVTFRIINSTNHIIYSKIMKNGGKSYACVKCGKIDPDTNGVVISEKPISLDLLNKNKRDNFQEFRDFMETTDFPVKKDSEGVFFYIEPEKEVHIIKHKHGATCQSMKHIAIDDDDDIDMSDD